MCLAFDARAATRDVDAYFEPSVEVLEAALRVAAREGLPESWLNDAVKGYLSDRGSFEPFLHLAHLQVFCARPDYMLAMKCLAMRIGEGFHDEQDVRYLVRNLGLQRLEDAREILARFYALQRYPETAMLLLEDLLPPPDRSIRPRRRKGASGSRVGRS